MVGKSNATVDMAHAPTSQPTIFFVAPTVPEDLNEAEEPPKDNSLSPSPISESTHIPTLQPSFQDGTGSVFNEEIVEENRIAINASSYIFYTFVGLIATVAAAYYFKR